MRKILLAIIGLFFLIFLILSAHAFFSIWDFFDSKMSPYYLCLQARKDEKNNQLEKAVKEYKEAAEQGDAKAQYNLAVMYLYGKGVRQDDAEAVSWYRKAADQGLADAQFSLGVMYDEGRGVRQNDAEAVLWYRKAADQEFAKAQFNLGIMYIQGKGVRQNFSEAKEWIGKACDNKMNEACKAYADLNS